jgi:hypothetical protein
MSSCPVLELKRVQRYVEIGVYTGVLVIRVSWAAPACSPKSAPTMHVTPRWSDIALSRLELHVPRT